MKELIQIHLDYEDELEERWSEIISNVEGKVRIQYYRVRFFVVEIGLILTVFLEIRRLQDQLQVQEVVSADSRAKINDLVAQKRNLERDLETVSV